MKQTRKSQSIGIIAGCAMILCTTHGFGQQQDTTKTVLLNEVVITATRSEKKINEIGRSITVLSSKDIKSTGLSTVSELLNREGGIYIVGAQQNPGSLSSIYTRGANSNHTVIMIDGVRITDPSSTDNAVDLSELSLSNVDRIEIVRGSHSTLYGSSAIGGVINIITAKNYKTPGVHVAAGVNAGVFEIDGSILSENLSLNYTLKSGLYLNAEVFNAMNKGFNSTVDTVTSSNVYKHPDMSDGFHKTDITGKIGYKTDKFDLFASYKKVSQKTDIDDGAFRDDENYTMNFDRGLISYGASYKFNEKLSLGFNGGLSDITRKLVDDSSRVNALGTTDKSYFSGNYSSSISNNELQANYTVKGLQLVAGGGLYKETMTAKTYYYSNQWDVYESETNLDTLNINATTSNVFIHADLNGELLNKSLSPFSIGLGARFVNHSLFGSVLTYEINPSFKISDNTLLYLSYTTGFNAPSLYQLYSPEKDYTSGITRGNKTLQPEESRSWEIGMKQNVNDNLWWSVCYFNTVVENVVDYVYLWDKNKDINSLSYMDYRGDTYINLGRQTNRGVEFSIQSKISDKLMVAGNFSLVYGKLDYNPDNIDTTHTHGNHIQLFSNGAFITKETESIGLVRRPNTANINLTYLPIKKLALRFDVNYAGARNDIYYNTALGPFGALGTVGMEDYTLLGFAAKYEILKGLTAMVRVENILNTNYYEIQGYATRGRGVYGSINYAF